MTSRILISAQFATGTGTKRGEKNKTKHILISECDHRTTHQINTQSAVDHHKERQTAVNA